MGKNPNKSPLHIIQVAASSTEPSNAWRAFLKSLRPHQWAKNSLLFVPLIMAQKEGEAGLLACATLSFVAFCLTASGVYLLNDLVDLSSDRLHPIKKNRPFASGALSPTVGYLTVPLFMISGLATGALLSASFVYLLAGYIAVNLAYSFHLKKLALLDVLVLAGFYCLRIFAGAIAIHVEVSEWLLSFSLFLFLSLALAKRISELKMKDSEGTQHLLGRGYQSSDADQLMVFGSVSGYLSVLVYALYIYSDHVKAFYRHPQFLWLLFPLLLYWISRIWLISSRGLMDADPLVFTLRDGASRVVIILAILSILLARGYVT